MNEGYLADLISKLKLIKSAVQGESNHVKCA